MPVPEISYFELQAYVGTTKHMGGLETTKELIELCHINRESYVLDVGCGVGATACYLAKRFGCRVVGVDIRESMIARSNERAQKEAVANLVEFKVADAQHLPFEDALFDAVLCESVTTFIEDKQQVVNECARVVRPGGYVGLNEELWLQTPPAQMVERVRHIWSIKPNILTLEGWMDLLEGAGLNDIVPEPTSSRRDGSPLKCNGIVLQICGECFTEHCFCILRVRLSENTWQRIGISLRTLSSIWDMRYSLAGNRNPLTVAMPGDR
mgnify:CR=1 FL=1